ncbi:hypothetical protein [Nocardia blacklockiae]|uniref:hypothetical protein n=1 Tax=Nocardia blacklockiae TaxID=480036 RepID=UPI001894BEB0|nr:hypothetical protein [Nocardia blacklockiae]MBF6174445.1 hypothetical protein [Nocardia blacklockiae]
MSRRKLAVLAGAVPLGTVAVGAAYYLRENGEVQSAAVQGAAHPEGSTGGYGTIPTQAAPAPGLAPEISRIGSRHIAALHSIHLFLDHMANYGPENLDGYFAGAINFATGAYRQHLLDTHDATRNFYLATNRRSQLLEFNCGLRAITGTVALGIGYVKQSVTSDLTPNPDVSLTASVTTAEEQPDGRWLVSDLKLISA